MTSRLHPRRLFSLVSLTVLALGLAACGSSSDPATPDPSANPTVDVVNADDVACPTEGEEWEVAKVYIEHNATDDDTGFHGIFGGEAWRELCLVDPDGNQIWLVDPQGQLHDLAVSDFFFESREPPADEYTIDDLKADFPEGDYTVSGTDFEGTPRIGTARFTHAIPAPATITEPTLADDAETAADSLVPRSDLVVTWDPVTETIDGDPVDITGYEVIVTTEEFDDPDGNSRPIYDVHVDSDTTSLSVPTEWLQPDTVYELEVLALEESGNQTISVGFFGTT